MPKRRMTEEEKKRKQKQTRKLAKKIPFAGRAASALLKRKAMLDAL